MALASTSTSTMPFRSALSASEALHAVGLRAPVALTHRVPDPVAPLQRFRSGDHGPVDEQVVTSGVGADDPEPAVPVVPCDDALAGAGGHTPGRRLPPPGGRRPDWCRPSRRPCGLDCG